METQNASLVMRRLAWDTVEVLLGWASLIKTAIGEDSELHTMKTDRSGGILPIADASQEWSSWKVLHIPKRKPQGRGQGCQKQKSVANAFALAWLDMPPQHKPSVPLCHEFPEGFPPAGSRNKALDDK